jgi:hypothetical protein
MRRKFSGNYSLSVVVPFVAVLIALVAMAALAQMPGAGQRPIQQAVLPVQQGAGAAGAAAQLLQRPLLPGATNAGTAHASHPRAKRHGARPMDAGPFFLPATLYDAGGTSGAYGIGAVAVVADVNGDGKPDIVVTNPGPNTVGVLLGNGDGTFQPAVTYGSGGPVSSSLAVADLTGDGKQDIVVPNWWGGGGWGNYDGAVDVLMGNGDGTFQPPVSYDAGGWLSIAVAVADVNGDGKPDIAVANFQGSSVTVLLNNGDGTFRPAVSYPTGVGATAVAIGDVNGDGKPDLVVAVHVNGNCSGSAVEVLLGNGDGTFQPAVGYDTGGACPGSVTVADVNGDGKLDIVVGNGGGKANGDGVVGVLLGNGDGTFQPAQAYDSGGSGAGSVAVADVNGDGNPDIVLITGSPETSNISILLGNGDGTFQSALTYGSGATPVSSIVVADVNHDGNPDLVVGNTTGGNNGDGSVGVLLHTGTTPTTTTLASSMNPAGYNQLVTYSATVTTQDGGAATGTVAFQDGGTTVATVPVANNQAAFSTAYKKGGVHAITAAYSGTLKYAGSTSATLAEHIKSLPSKTVVTTSGSPSLVGQPVTFTATVTSTHGAIPDGELVTFYDGKTAIGTGTTANGVATFTTSSLTAKTHTINAAYPGDDTFEPGTGLVRQVVDKYTTTTALSSSLNPSNYKQAVTFTATVTSAGPNTPTGKVEFKDGTKSIGSAILNAGVATLTKSMLAVGSHPITAEYLGDTSSAESTSSVLDQVVE